MVMVLLFASCFLLWCCLSVTPVGSPAVFLLHKLDPLPHTAIVRHQFAMACRSTFLNASATYKPKVE